MKKIFICIMLMLYLFVGCTNTRSIPDISDSSPTEIQEETVQPPEPEPTVEPAEPPAEEEPEPEPEPLPEPKPEPDPEAEITYILNKNTKKFHKPTCRSAKQISSKNYAETSGTREEVVAQGYSPCGNCKP